MLNNNCILSIIIPVYNAESNIAKLIHKLQESKYHRITEIICIDDGSLDNSLPILESLKTEIENLQVIHQENQGVSSARNLGLDKAVGTFVYFIDSDDEIKILEFDKTLERIVKEDIDLGIFGIVDRFYKKNGKLTYRNNYACDKTYDDKAFYSDLGRLLNKHILYSPCNKMFKRSIIENNNIRYDVNFTMGEDILFNIAYFYFVKKVEMFSDVVYIYNHNENKSESGSSQYNENEKEILLHIVEEVRKLLVQKETMEENEAYVNTFIVRKLSFLLNKVYAKNSPLTDEEKNKYIKDLYLDKDIQNAIGDTRVKMDEVDQKLLLLLHKKHVGKGIHILYKIKNH